MPARGISSPAWLVLLACAGCGSGARIVPTVPDAITRPDEPFADAAPAAAVDAGVDYPPLATEWELCGQIGLGAFQAGAPATSVPLKDPVTGDLVPVLDLAVSPDGQWLAASGLDRPRAIWIWRLPDQTGWRQIERLPDGAGISLALSPDGTRIAAAGDGRAIYSVADGTELFDLPAPAVDIGGVYAATSVQFSPDGRYLGVGGWGRYGYVISVDDGRLVATLPSAMESPSLAFSQDSAFVATSVPELISIPSGTIRWSHPRPSLDGFYVDSTVELSPDDATLLVSTCSGDTPFRCTIRTRLFRTSDGQVVADLGTTLPRRPQFLPDGKHLLAGATIVDLTTRRTTTLPVTATVSVYLPDGRIAAGGPDGVVRILCPRP